MNYLTDKAIHNARAGIRPKGTYEGKGKFSECDKHTGKPYNMPDGKGLYLLVTLAGSKLWRMKYRFMGKEKLLTFGVYPVITLKDARIRRSEALKMLDEGKDPNELKKAQKAAIEAASANTFESVAREWYEAWSANVSPATASRQLANLERNVFPTLGDVPVSEIRPKTVLDTLRAVELRGVQNTVLKAKTAVSQIMRYAVQTDRAENDPVPNLRGAIKKPEEKHMAAITEPVKVGELLRSIAQYKGSHVVRSALALAPLVFVRPGELRAAKWAEIDLERGEWRYFVSKTKTEHLVPLARQAVDILRGIWGLTGRGEFVFPGERHGRPISNATINRALQSMGYDTKTEMTGHGFRAMARTLLAEELGIDPQIIEHQLAHKVPDALGTAYNRTKFIDRRWEMMQSWADYLDRLKQGALVIPIRA